jgi:hypothetical protein
MKLVNETIQMADAISKYSYGVIAMAVIVVVFLAVFIMVIMQNKSFTKELMDRNKELFDTNKQSVSELKNAINELNQNIKSLSVNYEFILGNITDHIRTLENKYETVTCQMLEGILDDRMLSKRTYFTINKFIILTYVEKTIVAITEHFDRNGLNCDERLKLFKENISRDMEKYKNLAIEEMTQLEFDTLKKEKFIERILPIYEKCFKEIKETIINDFCGCEIETTPHYFHFKQQIKNKFNEMSENLLNILKEILR